MAMTTHKSLSVSNQVRRAGLWNRPREQSPGVTLLGQARNTLHVIHNCFKNS